MSKRMVMLLVFLLVVVGIIIISKQREQAIQVEQMETQAANELRRVTAEAQKAKQAALEETKRIEAEAQKAKQAALEIARQAEAEAQKAKEMAVEAVRERAAEIQAQINELLAQAKALMESEEYQGAIDAAKGILALDPNSLEATTIIEQATAKLKEMAKDKVDALTSGLQGQLEVPEEGLVVPAQP